MNIYKFDILNLNKIINIMEILNYNDTNDIEMLISDIYNDFLKCSNIIKSYTLDKIKNYFENNKRVFKLHNNYIKY